MRFVCIVLLFTIPAMGYAEPIYVCKTQTGAVTYTNTKCASTELSSVSKEQPISVVPHFPAERYAIPKLKNPDVKRVMPALVVPDLSKYESPRESERATY